MTPCVRFKAGVQCVTPPTPGGVRILGAAERLARILGKDTLVTCGTEGHTPPDPHCRGEAFDLSVGDYTPEETLQAVRQLQGDLGSQFYLQYEVPSMSVVPVGPLQNIAVVNHAATGPHLHVQVTKGTVYP